MVDILTYKATEVYTPKTNKWAYLAKDVQAIGKTVAGGVKAWAKQEAKKEREELAQQKEVRKQNEQIEKQNVAMAKQKAGAYDKMLDAQADNAAQRFQIDLARQTAFINQQYSTDPTNPEKENQIRAVAKDLQAQYMEKMPQATRKRFMSKTETKTNEYILSDLKDSIKGQLKDTDNIIADGINTSIADAQKYAQMGDFDAVNQTFISKRGELEDYLSGLMTPEQQQIALRQFDQKYMTSVLKSIAEENPDLARDFKNNPAATSALLSGGDYLTELALRSELNDGQEQIDGMTFDKNGRYQKEKERAKLVNSLGLVPIEYNNGGEKALTLASSSADPELTSYTAELLGGAAGKDLDLAIKNADNTQKAKLAQAQYDGAVQSVLRPSYENLAQIKNSQLYKDGDKATRDFADRYEQIVKGREEAADGAANMTDEELSDAYANFVKALEKIDGKSIEPIMEAQKWNAKIQAAWSVREVPKWYGQWSDQNAGVVLPEGYRGASSSSLFTDPYKKAQQEVQQAFENAVINQDFRAGLTQTVKNHWVAPDRSIFAGETPVDKETFLNRPQERSTRKAENEAILGMVTLFNQGRMADGVNFYNQKRNEFYDQVYSNYFDIDAVNKALSEGKNPFVCLNNQLMCCVGRDTDGNLLFEPQMTKVKY